MSSDSELFVTERIAEYDAVRDVLISASYHPSQMDYLRSNLSDRKTQWPEHVKIPVVETDTRVATVHVQLIFEPVHRGFQGRMIEPTVDAIGIEFHETASVPIGTIEETYGIETTFDDSNIITISQD